MSDYEPAKSCGCDTYTSGGDIVFCRLHEAAPDFLRMLQRVEGWLANDLKECGPGPSGGYRLRLEAVQAVLAKAEGR
jgi:hypothetical protein